MRFHKGTHKEQNIAGYGIITIMDTLSGFAKAGYNKPKHHLEAFGESLFYWAVKSCYPWYSHGYKMIFVINKSLGYERLFVEEYLTKLQITNVDFVELDSVTDGQATIVMAASHLILDKTKPIFVHNIDTGITPFAMESVHKLSLSENIDGIIPCAILLGDSWSFAKVIDDKVVKIAEKNRISNLATLGFYYFKSFNMYSKLYNQTYNTFFSKLGLFKKKKYIAPMYQIAIDDGSFLVAPIIDLGSVQCFGTPEQYQDFLNK